MQAAHQNPDTIERIYLNTFNARLGDATEIDATTVNEAVVAGYRQAVETGKPQVVIVVRRLDPAPEYIHIAVA